MRRLLVLVVRLCCCCCVVAGGFDALVSKAEDGQTDFWDDSPLSSPPPQRIFGANSDMNIQYMQ